MKAVYIIKKYLARAGIYFSFLTAAYAALTATVNYDDPRVTLLATRVVFLFLFSVTFAFSGAFFEIKQVGKALARTLHFASCAASFFVFLIVPMSPSPSNVLIAAVFFTAAYLVYYGLKAFFSARFKKLFAKSEEYTPRFDKTAKK